MKPGRLAVALCALLCAGGVVVARAVQPGDTRDAVIAELGNPTGVIDAGSMTVLVYPRGEIRLRDGRVSTVNLVSEEELAARQATEAEARSRAEADRAARLARLEKQGQALRVAKKSDSDFAMLPASEQLAYWRSFAVRFPMISVQSEIEPLLARANEEARLREINRANEERLASLESRLAETEERAARAERDARRARYDGSGWGVWAPFVPGRAVVIRGDHDGRWRGHGNGRDDHDHDHGDHDGHDFHLPPLNENESPPQVDAVTEARARAMGEIEEHRNEVYRRAGP